MEYGVEWSVLCRVVVKSSWGAGAQEFAEPDSCSVVLSVRPISSLASIAGTVPIVRKTGGLNDTVFDVDHDKERAAEAGVEPNGCVFICVCVMAANSTRALTPFLRHAHLAYGTLARG